MAYWTDEITKTDLWKIELLNQWLLWIVIFPASNTFHYPNWNLQIKQNITKNTHKKKPQTKPKMKQSKAEQSKTNK